MTKRDLWDDDQYDDDDDFDEEPQRRKPNPLRQLREQNKELKRTLDEAMAQIKEFKDERVRTLVPEALKSRRLDPKVADLIPESVQSDPKALTEFLDKYADVFGQKAPEGQQTQQENPGGLPQGDADALARMQSVQQGALTPEIAQNHEARMLAATTPEELAAVIQSMNLQI